MNSSLDFAFFKKETGESPNGVVFGYSSCAAAGGVTVAAAIGTADASVRDTARRESLRLRRGPRTCVHVAVH